MSTVPSLGRSVYKLCPTCHSIYLCNPGAPGNGPGSDDRCSREGSALVDDDRIFAGKFILVRKIGEGGMGAVYEAEQPQIGRTVAVKILRPDPEIMMRFEREVQAAGALNHTNVVTVHDSGVTEDGRGYIAMEYLEGESLARCLERQGPLPPPLALGLWTQAVRAMAAAHGKGVVHRDLKPDNIFLARRQGDEADETVVKVVDFGIAKFHKRAPQAKGTTPGFVIGTMQYMAPEQMQGAEADPRGDVYALGLILVEMLTARLPWGSSQQDAYADFALRLVKPPLPLQQLRPEQQFSPQLQRLVEELLALEPSQRPAHAGEVLQRLKQVPEAQGADFSGQTHARALAGIAPAEGISAPVRRSTGTEVVAQSRLTGMSGATTPRLRLVMVIGGVAATLLLCGGVYLEWRGPAGSRVHPTPIEPPAAVVKGPSPQPIAPARGPEPAGGPEAAKSVPHRAQHESPALQVQFAFTDIKGVRLTCGGKRLPAPDCSAAGICKSVATVAVGQKCIAEKDGDKKVFTYKGLQKTEADRKNMIHVPVLFP